ncbi:hypothetical protein B0H16DRAFT_1467875 [Mycena metata]|uniref:Uncharacterized protein n=1 Tax=Mycena metata TaxID=1033252 RepID=A0AAD7MUR7_9AGAR|nr:hypothetical protein B0H16DRAFT_1467875 [Mycena metata]
MKLTSFPSAKTKRNFGARKKGETWPKKIEVKPLLVCIIREETWVETTTTVTIKNEWQNQKSSHQRRRRAIAPDVGLIKGAQLSPIKGGGAPSRLITAISSRQTRRRMLEKPVISQRSLLLSAKPSHPARADVIDVGGGIQVRAQRFQKCE